MRYLLVAGTTTLLYIGLVAAFLALARAQGWHYMVAILAAQAVIIAVAFPAYRTFIFGPGASAARDFARFLTVWSSGAIAGVVATPLLVEITGLAPLVAQVIAIVVVAVGSYAGHALFSFRGPPSP